MIQKLIQFLLFTAHTILQRPSVGAVIVLRRGDEVLLVRSAYRSGWHLPGGFLNQKEPFVSAVRREVLEEIGHELDEVELVDIIGGGIEWPAGRNYVALYTSASFHQVFERKPNWEIQETRWFPGDQLPDDATPFVKTCVKLVLAAKRN